MFTGSPFQGSGAAGSGWTDVGSTVRLVTSGDKVVIGAASGTATGLQVQHATQAEFIVTKGETDWCAWTNDTNTVFTWGDADSNRDLVFQKATGFPFSGTTEIARFVASDKTLRCQAAVNLSAVGTTSASLVVRATTNTPTAAWGTTSAAAIAVTTAPSGWLQIEVGGSARYTPFWA